MDRRSRDAHPAGHGMRQGERVEVRTRFDQQWARGFEIAEVVDDGYVVRRVSDGCVLPVSFCDDDVRGQQP